MDNLWPIILISISLLVIIFIIIRHFPALAVLDASNIPEEKEQQIKEKIIKSRMTRKFSFLNKFFGAISDWFNKLFNILHFKLSELQKKQKKQQEDQSMLGISLEEKNKILFSQADEFIKEENFEEAEKKLIEIISLDDKNFTAFFELGEVYHSEGKWQEAKQTLLYANKLAEVFSQKVTGNEVANLNYSLALINKELNDLDGAITNLYKSLEIDQNNPRYLDLMLDLCIIKKDKGLALRFLEKIKEINPDNNNISKWEEEVSQL
ncbi:MAG TPA: hypothetical protein PLE28_03345 [bacterium]|nr:hypothetical protein [bacterium]